jgi:shikimate 5-dehydrogenase
VRAEDGRAVLVGQGAAAFALFFGVPAPLAVMQRAVDDALGA